MRPFLDRSARRLAALTSLLAVIAGCGGGGGGGSGGSGGGGFSVSPGSLTFEAPWSGAPPAGQTVTMQVTNPAAAYLGWLWPDGDPGWLTLGSVSGSGGTYQLTASIVNTGLAPGTYTTRFTVGIANVNDDVLAARDVSVSYTVRPALRVAETAVAWSWVEGATSTVATDLHLQGAGLTWTASADQTWIQLAAASGASPATLRLTLLPAGVGRGAHRGTVTITPSSGAPVQVPVDLTVVAPRLVGSAGALAFSGTNGAAIAGQQLGLRLSSFAARAWTATTSAGWLVLDRASGVTPDTVAVSVDPAIGPLASGPHDATLTVTADVDGEVLTTTVSVHLALGKAILAVTPSTLALGGAAGRDLSSRSVQVSLDTGARTHPYTVEASAGWLVPTPASGSASGTPATVVVAPDATGLAAGPHAGGLTVTARVNGDVLVSSVPVTFGLDRHLLLASAQGVAFASMPGLSSTTRTLRVRDNFGASTAWTATGSAPWLTVTPSGTTPSDLVLTADPTGLATDTLHTARVTIHSDDPSIARDELVEVGLWVGATAPAAVVAAPAAPYAAVAADPVRPYAYAHAGGTEVQAVNVYTGAIVRTYPGVGARLGELTISGDGATLFAHDLTNLAIVPLDLASGAVGTPWPLGAAGGRLAYGRTNGTGLVHAGSACAFEAATGGRIVGTACTGIPAVSRDGTRLCWLATGYTPADAWCAPLDHTPAYATAGGGTLLRGASAHATLSGSNFQVSVNGDGSRAHVANGGPYRVFDAATMAGLQALAWAPVDVAWDGRVLAYRWDDQDLVVYGTSGAELGTCDVGVYGYDPPFRRAVFSGDGLRAIVAYPGSNVLRFATASR